MPAPSGAALLIIDLPKAIDDPRCQRGGATLTCRSGPAPRGLNRTEAHELN